MPPLPASATYRSPFGANPEPARVVQSRCDDFDRRRGGLRGCDRHRADQRDKAWNDSIHVGIPSDCDLNPRAGSSKPSCLIRDRKRLRGSPAAAHRPRRRPQESRPSCRPRGRRHSRPSRRTSHPDDRSARIAAGDRTAHGGRARARPSALSRNATIASISSGRERRHAERLDRRAVHRLHADARCRRGCTARPPRAACGPRHCESTGAVSATFRNDGILKAPSTPKPFVTAAPSKVGGRAPGNSASSERQRTERVAWRRRRDRPRSAARRCC